MDLKSKLFLNKPRENSGSTTSNRFDYQKNWAICKLVDLHRTAEDYLLCFEFHDDIIVFDSETDPQKIKCYQVKTKDSAHWLLSSLTKVEKENGASILAKLHQHYLDYEGSIESLSFVTNSKVKGTLANNFKCVDLGEFMLKDLCAEDLKKITDKLSVELETDDLDKFNELTIMVMGELDLKHHSEITQSKLAKLVEEIMPHVKYQIGPFYRTVFDEVRNKTNVEEQAVNFERLKKMKSISRRDFATFLGELAVEDPMKDIAISIEQRLNAESVDFKFVNEFRNQAKVYEIAKMNRADKNLSDKIREIRNLITEKPSGAPTLLDQMNEIYAQSSPGTNLINELYIKTIILFELYGKR